MNAKTLLQGTLFLLFFLLVSGFLVYNISQILSESNNAQAADISQSVLPTPVVPPAPPFALEAEAALSVQTNLIDPQKTLFSKNGSEILPIASLTKLMTAVIVLDNYNLDDMVTVDAVADSQSVAVNDVSLGQTQSVDNLLKIMLLESSNKSAYALSEKMGEPEFVALMNQKAKKIGLQNTFFLEPTGLSQVNVSTAQDLATISIYILENYPAISEISKTKEMTLPNFGTIENIDQLLGQVPGILIGKTGFTDDAKGCLLLVMYDQKTGEYNVDVILGSDDRFTEMQNMIDWVNTQYK